MHLGRYLPYRKTDGTIDRDERCFSYLAARGVAGLRVDIRGSGSSEGKYHDEYSQAELDDGVAVIAWCSKQAWCDGKTFLYGKSWGGFNALQIAALRPAGLAGVFAAAFTDDRYAEDVHYWGGCVKASEMMPWGAYMLAINALPPAPGSHGALTEAGQAGAWRARLDALEPWAERWLEHQMRDAYWRHGSVCDTPDAINVPVFMLAGFLDSYKDAAFRMMSRRVRNPAPMHALVGPWAHCWPNDAIPGPGVNSFQLLVDFVREPTRQHPHAMTLWQYDVSSAIDQAPQQGRWIGLTRPPAMPPLDAPAGSTGSTLVFCAVAPDSLVASFDPRATQAQDSRATLRVSSLQLTGVTGGGPQCLGDGRTLQPGDQALDDALSAVLSTDQPLSAPLDLAGLPCVRLRLRCDKARAAVVLRLTALLPDGSSVLLARGARNLLLDDSFDALADEQDHEDVGVRIVLSCLCCRVPAGAHLRLAISTAYWPMLWPAAEPATLHVLYSGTQLELPLLDPANCVSVPASLLPPPVATKGFFSASQTSVLRNADTTCQIDVLKGTARRVERAPVLRQCCDAFTQEESVERVYSITANDPLSARVECSVSLRYSVPDAGAAAMVTAGTAHSPARAQELGSVAQVQQHGFPVLVEPLIDGVRVFVHKHTDAAGAARIAVLSAVAPYPQVSDADGLQLGDALPHAIAAALQPVTSCVLDAMLVVRARGQDGRLKPYLTLAGAKADGWRAATTALIVFDATYINERSIVNEPLTHRRSLLTATVTPVPDRVLIAPAHVAEDVDDVIAVLHDVARVDQCDGIVVKRLSVGYPLGKRGWLKLRVEDATDLPPLPSPETELAMPSVWVPSDSNSSDDTGTDGASAGASAGLDVRVDVRAVMTADARHFHVSHDLDVRNHDEYLVSTTFTKAIPRLTS